MTRGAGSPIASFLVRVARRVISLAWGRRFVVLLCVAASALLGRLLGFLPFALSLGKGVLVLSCHALQIRGWVLVSGRCGPLPLPAQTGPKYALRCSPRGFGVRS